MKTHRLRGLAVAAAVLLVASCGGDDDGGTDDGTSPEGTSASTEVTDASTDVTGVSAATTADTGESTPTTPGSEAPHGALRVGAQVALASFDPHISTDFAASYLFPVYDTLTVQDADGAAQPNLATSWERVDELTWRYELRDDVMFHDGSSFDATVVKKNLDRAQGVETSPHAAQLGGIAEVTVVDDYTVDIAYERATPVSPLDLSMTAGMMISGDAIDAETDLSRAPAGSGGWIWDADASQEGGVQVYARNPDYWAPEAQGVEEVTVLHIGESQARVNALVTGEVDMIDGVPTSLQSTVEDAGANLVTFPVGFSGVFLGDRVGLLSPELSDPLVREAIGLSIDRAGYREAIDGGVGELGTGYFPASSPWHDETLAESSEPDYERARELLEEAGYPNGISFKLATYPTIDAAVQAIAQMLAPAGINVEIVQIQGNGTAEVIKGNFVGTWVSSRTTHPHSLYQNYAATTGNLNQAFQATDMEDLDARMADAAVLDDEAEQKVIYDEVQQALVERNFLFVFNHAGLGAATGADVTGAYLGGGQSGPRPQNVRVG